MKKTRPYNIVIIKECYATIQASSEEEAIELGNSLYGEENYDDTTIKSVRCLGEKDFDLGSYWDSDNEDWDDCDWEDRYNNDNINEEFEYFDENNEDEEW